MNLRQIGPLRPQPKTEIPGLFLAGASMGWGPGVEGVMLSGVGAAGAVLRRDLFAEIRNGRVFGAADQLPAHDQGWDPLAVATDTTLRGQKARVTNKTN
jgi:all-trans-retinol 13,14-reductase